MQRIRGKLRKSILRSTKVQGNWGGTHKYISEAKKSARKVQGNWGETQKINFKVYKSAGKLGGNSKNQIHFLRLRKVEGNCRETAGKLKKSILRSKKVHGNCRETGGGRELKNTF